jgi:hypothetical protein
MRGELITAKGIVPGAKGIGAQVIGGHWVIGSQKSEVKGQKSEVRCCHSIVIGRHSVVPSPFHCAGQAFVVGREQNSYDHLKSLVLLSI